MRKFDRFYDVFLNNQFRGDIYAVSFVDGQVSVGAPAASSLASPTDEAEFSMTLNGQLVARRTFGSIHEAHRLVPCLVRTIGPHSVGGGDFTLHILEPLLERALLGDGVIELDGIVLPPTNYRPDLPAGTYKHVTINGADFSLVHDPVPSGNGALRIAIERID